MTSTVDGFPVLEPGSHLLHTWVLPGIPRRLTLRNGSAGLLIAFTAHWYNEHVERLDFPGEGTPDDGGYADRPITGGTTPTKHKTGTAADLNWRRHPYNTVPVQTYTGAQLTTIYRFLRRRGLAGVIEWGGTWPSHAGSTAKPDPMHWQIHSTADLADCERVARVMIDAGNPRMRELLDANPGQRKVVFS